jgi:hypothetical protein
MDQKVIGAGGFSNANADDPSQRRAILEQLLKDNSTRDGAEVHTLKVVCFLVFRLFGLMVFAGNQSENGAKRRRVSVVQANGRRATARTRTKSCCWRKGFCFFFFFLSFLLLFTVVAQVLPEMVGLDELPAWLTAPPAPVDPEKAKFKDLDGVVSDAFGRGKRRKAEVEYTDQLDEDEFCMLMERGATEAEIKVWFLERKREN